MIADLGLESRSIELEQAVTKMHRHQRHLAGRNGGAGKNGPVEQAAAALQVALRGQRVRFDPNGDFARIGASVPTVTIDVAARMLVARHAAAA